MKYWWVNHTQTHRQEIEGGYMWSPVVERGGKFSQYYQNMRLVRAGDLVISYATTAVRALGTALDGAIRAPRPEEFGQVGLNWASSGWLVPVAWTQVVPFPPKTMLRQIAPLLPKKYSPIQAATGGGNQKAYLTEVSATLFAFIQAATGAIPSQETEAIAGTAARFKNDLADAEERRIRDDVSLTDTEKEQLCKARRGQGLFRKRLCAVEGVCRLTGIRTASLLIASHIKPWRSCATAKERLDESNGLLLAPHADYIFDRGLVSFDPNGEMLLSPYLRAADLSLLGLPSTLRTPFTDRQHSYLEYHRGVVFQS